MAQNPLDLPEPPSNIIDIAAETKRLTDRLLAAEQYLAALQWKVEAEISDGRFRLGFERRDRGWALVWREQYYVLPARDPKMDRFEARSWNPEPVEHWTDVLLRDASVAAKAKAAGMLPALMTKMRAEYDTRTANLEAGNEAIDAFEAGVRLGEARIEDPIQARIRLKNQIRESAKHSPSTFKAEGQ